MENGGADLEAKIETFLNVEKQMRQVGDVAGTRKAVTDILQLCFEAGAWKTLNDQIVLISKRRGQLKQAVQAMVQQAMQYIDQKIKKKYFVIDIDPGIPSTPKVLIC